MGTRVQSSANRVLALDGPGATYRLGSNLRPDRGDATSSSSVFTERHEGAAWYRQDDGQATFTSGALAHDVIMAGSGLGRPVDLGSAAPT